MYTYVRPLIERKCRSLNVTRSLTRRFSDGVFDRDKSFDVGHDVIFLFALLVYVDAYWGRGVGGHERYVPLLTKYECKVVEGSKQ